jgi:ABC-type uncharacterized transport system involved in gliding motility auxiliary subunit
MAEDVEDRKVGASLTGRRWGAGLNALLSVLLAGALAVLANILVPRLGPLRVQLSAGGAYVLSDKTRALVASLDQDVSVVSFFNPSHEMYRDIRNLLREYEYESAKRGGGHLKVRIVDPNRDLVKTRALKQKYDLAAADVVVFEAGGKCKYVDIREIAREHKNVDFEKLLSTGQGTYTRTVSFLGEQAFSSAIQNVTQAKPAVVYFLAGHGESEISDFASRSGCATLARMLRRDNIDVRPLSLSEHRGIPADCSAIVVVGPARKISRLELDVLSGYLDRSGRLCLMINPGIVTGLEGLIEAWGMKLDGDVVTDPNATLTGRELFISRFGNHAITQNLKNLAVILFGARSVEPLPEHDAAKEVQPDRSRVTVLARTSDKAWAERGDSLQNSPKFDSETDRSGPITVAVAVEKGKAGTIETAIRPTRMVVIGDADFVSNTVLDGAAGGNVDFFMSAMNWLLEREELMAIAPHPPEKIEFGLPQGRLKAVFIMVVFLGPLVAAVVGSLVWWRRRA